MSARLACVIAFVSSMGVWAGAVPARPAQVPRSATAAAGMVSIPAGSYLPLYAPAKRPDGSPVPRTRRAVPAFDIDAHAVTNAEYLAFVAAHPEWRKSAVKRVTADEAYLKHWRGDLDPGPDAPPGSPVVYVSWFAARAYLHALGKELPTVDQWEYVIGLSGPSRQVDVGQPLWEWTLDFNSVLMTGDARADASPDAGLFCGAGAIGASTFEDYQAFMRYALWSSLQARYDLVTLGFRGVMAHREGRP